jgi:NAD(P)-dependent dehydrogenase (short-subunit alcohol dehydrogenase family)
MNVNIKSVILTTQTFAKRFVQDSEYGRVVNIGSNLATRSGASGAGIYNMTKAAVASLTKTWAWDLASLNITVNCVEPGSTDTDMNPASSERAKERRKTIARGQYGKPEDIANAVIFSVSLPHVTLPALVYVWMVAKKLEILKDIFERNLIIYPDSGMSFSIASATLYIGFLYDGRVDVPYI